MNVKKYSKELKTFDDLSAQLHEIKIAFDTASDERADGIVICVLFILIILGFWN